MNVAIIGEKDSGKTTFLILLYAAQIKYSDVSEGEFRFYINPQSIKIISEEYNRMQLGSWPSDKLITRVGGVSFLYGREDSSAINSIMKIFGKPKSIPTITLNFSIYDFSDSELSEIVNSNIMKFMNISKRVESLLSTRVLIIIIDSSKLKRTRFSQENAKKRITDQNIEAGKNSDTYISNALTNISRYNRDIIYPIFVFTKFDLIDPRVLFDLKLPKKPPAINNLTNRKKFAERLLTKFYPNTLKMIKGDKKMNYDGHCFFTKIATQKNSDGSLSPALKPKREFGYELDCSYQEFNGFIEYIENISELVENK